MNLPLVSAVRWTSRRERVDRPARRGSTSWVMNHSGNCQQVMPVCGAGRVLVVGRRRVQLERRHLEQPLELRDQPRLGDLVAAAGPVVQAADDDRVVRQVEQRAGAEGGDDLALADLAVRAWHCVAGSCLVLLLDLDVVQRLAPTG